MKATFFYSHEQARRTGGYNLVKGMPYTEVFTQYGEHKSNFDDTEVVHVEYYLPVDLRILRDYDVICAELPFDIIEVLPKQKRFSFMSRSVGFYAHDFPNIIDWSHLLIP